MMSTTSSGVVVDPLAVERVASMGTLFTPWAMRASVTLRLPDLIAEGVSGIEALASLTGADSKALSRLLHHLANLELLRWEEPKGYVLTPLGEVLRSDHPAGVAGFLDQNDAWALAGDRVVPGLLHSVRTGQPAWEHIFGKPFWEALSADMKLAEAFDQAMSAHVTAIGPWLANAWSWKSVNRVVDVGGGTGKLLSAVLRAHPHLRGTVIEQDATAKRASAVFAEEGVADRASALCGNFFDPLPSNPDVCLLAHILHDWPDDDAISILRRCAEALPARGRLLVVDRIRDEDQEFSGQLAVSQRDMAMLVVLGGVERTRAEFHRLAEEAALRPTATLPTEEKGLYLMEFAPRDGSR